MSEAIQNRTTSRLSMIQIGIIVLGILTAVIHLYLASRMGFVMSTKRPMPLLFMLNFLGYLVLTAAYFLPQFLQYRQVIRWVFIVYTAITIVAWFAITNAHYNPIGYTDKVIEVALIVLLLLDMQRTRVS